MIYVRWKNILIFFFLEILNPDRALTEGLLQSNLSLPSVLHQRSTLFSEKCIEGLGTSSCICDIMKRLPSLVGPEEYHPFLLFHVGSNETATKRLWNIKRDFTSLRKTLKWSEVQVAFSSICPVGGWDPRRRWMDQVNNWLQGWCQAQGPTSSEVLLRDWARWHCMRHTWPGGATTVFWAASWLAFLAGL